MANQGKNDHAFTDAQFRVALDICVFLQVFHSAQELVSAEKTPTLSIVLLLYELLLHMLKDLARVKVKLAHAIKASVAKLQGYLAISRKTKIYTLATGMCITSLRNLFISLNSIHLSVAQ